MLLLNLTLSALPLEVQGLICQKLTIETIRVSSKMWEEERSVNLMEKVKQIIQSTH